MRARVLLAHLCIIGGLCCSGTVAVAADMQPLSDEVLSDIRGGDGISFLANLNITSNAFTLGVSDTAGNPATLAFNNIAITGPAAWTLDVVGGGASSDFVNFGIPAIGFSNPLSMSFDLAVTANGSTFGTGVSFQNMLFNGSSLQLTPNTVSGVNFGLGLNMAVGNVLLQPNGVGNTSGQMSFSGITVGAATTGAPNSVGIAPWVIADLVAQPGIFAAAVDSGGNPYIEIGIGWPTGPTPAASGSIQINDIKFATPSGNVDLGASSIGSMQIQYLNIKLKS
jgi:hypothetical protein